MDFETLTAPHRRAIEAYVKFKVSDREDAQDILQETWLAAYLHFSELRDPTRVKPWLLSIARSRMNDYFRYENGEVTSFFEVTPVIAHCADILQIRFIQKSWDMIHVQIVRDEKAEMTREELEEYLEGYEW